MACLHKLQCKLASGINGLCVMWMLQYTQALHARCKLFIHSDNRLTFCTVYSQHASSFGPVKQWCSSVQNTHHSLPTTSPPSIFAHSVGIIQGAHGKHIKKLQCAEIVALVGEFEPHANAWMGWPDSGMLWREDAKPAQKQYADVAKAISEFEPVVMMANPEVCTLLQILKPTVLASCIVIIMPLSSSPCLCAIPVQICQWTAAYVESCGGTPLP